MNDPYTPPTATPPSLPPAPPVNWRLYMELSSLAMFVVPAFGNILGPLVLWLIKKDTIREVDEAGKAVLNFNLSWTIWIIVSCGLGVIPWIIIDIIAILKAANNERFEHPLTIRFLR